MYADFDSIVNPENEDVDVTQGVDTGIESSTEIFQEAMSIQIFHDRLSYI